MKRPNAEQIRAESNRRRIQEAEAKARSDAVADARLVEAADCLVAANDLDDFEAAPGASTAIEEASPGRGTRTS